MEYSKGDRIELREDFFDTKKQLTIASGTRGIVKSVMPMFKHYWINFEGFETASYVSENVDMIEV